MCLLKFWARELVGYRIKLCIQWVPTLHTFDGPLYQKNKKYLKKCDDDIIITSKVCRVGTRWMRNLIPHQRSLPIEIWVKTQGDMSKIQTKKVVFFFSSSQINKYYFIILTIILLSFLGGPSWVEIFSNVCIIFS